MNVQEYLQAMLPPHRAFDFDEEWLDILAEMPVDTPCGESCTAAIDACKRLSNHVSEALGYNAPQIDELWCTSVYTCVVYIRG